MLKDDIFKSECNQDILNTIDNFDENSNPHIKWEYLKYQCRKFAISFSKRNKKEQLSIQKHHENVITQYETTTDKPSEEIYNQSKLFHENLIENRTKGPFFVQNAAGMKMVKNRQNSSSIWKKREL